FLISSYTHILRQHTKPSDLARGNVDGSLLKPKQWEFLESHAFTGFDNDANMVKIAILNLYLHQLERARIEHHNPLTTTQGGQYPGTKYDVILANPPFAGRVQKESILADINLDTRDTELLFLKWFLDHLTDHGRTGVIVPNGVLFGSGKADRKVRQLFLALKGTDFASESAIVRFLEEAHNVIADYDVPGFEDFYRRLLSDAVRKFNLRYRLDEPFTLRFLLPGSFNNLYAELHRLNTGNGHLAGLLTDFEKAFDRCARTQDPADLRICIGNASKYVEGLAGATCGKAGSLGELCKEIKDWPHVAVQAALSNLYGFCSDYPGIRHAGNPKGVRRDLATRDMTLASLLLLSFSGYLSPSVDERAVLGL
ncbi:MAG: HsdM family class I SAM-dependent methyltransferase, partial [Gammaproteobacteria bacterium]